MEVAREQHREIALDVRERAAQRVEHVLVAELVATELAGERRLAHWRRLGDLRAQGHEVALPVHGHLELALDPLARRVTRVEANELAPSLALGGVRELEHAIDPATRRVGHERVLKLSHTAEGE